MAARPLTKRAVDAAQADPNAKFGSFLWCEAMPAFGVRVYPSGKKVFIVRVPGSGDRGRSRMKIGPYGPFTVEDARKRAIEILRAAADGRDPQQERQDARKALTVAELCEQYITAARAGLVITRFGRPKSPATVAIDEGRISRHIVPLIGKLPARDLRRGDVQRMLDSIASGKTAAVVKTKARGRAVVTGGAGTAARVVELLGGIYSWAQKREFVPDGPNPARGVDKARGAPKDRVLTADELRALGDAMRSREADQPAAVRALRLVALTGLRRDEACGLRWREVDELGQCLRLESTKTGRSTRPVGKAAIALLGNGNGSEWVFPRADGNGSADLKRRFAEIFDAAGLHDARAHDLRRTYASVAADLGFGDATIAELLGHARRGVTEKHYVRRSDPVLISAADKVADYISEALAGIRKSADIREIRQM